MRNPAFLFFVVPNPFPHRVVPLPRFYGMTCAGSIVLPNEQTGDVPTALML